NPVPKFIQLTLAGPKETGDNPDFYPGPDSWFHRRAEIKSHTLLVDSLAGPVAGPQKEAEMRSAFRCAFLVLMLLIAISVCAQTEPKGSWGVIAGRVSAEGTPVAGITVIVTSGASFQGGVAGRATTDDQGNYRVTGLAAGEYSISPFAPAFYNPLTQFSGP